MTSNLKYCPTRGIGIELTCRHTGTSISFSQATPPTEAMVYTGMLVCSIWISNVLVDLQKERPWDHLVWKVLLE